MASQDHGIHSCKECVPEGSNYFQQTLGRRRSSLEAIEDQALTIQRTFPQAMRNMKNSILKEPLIHLIIWIRNDDVINEEDDKVEGSRRSLPMKRIKDKYSIVIA